MAGFVTPSVINAVNIIEDYRYGEPFEVRIDTCNNQEGTLEPTAVVRMAVAFAVPVLPLVDERRSMTVVIPGDVIVRRGQRHSVV